MIARTHSCMLVLRLGVWVCVCMCGRGRRTGLCSCFPPWRPLARVRGGLWAAWFALHPCSTLGRCCRRRPWHGGLVVGDWLMRHPRRRPARWPRLRPRAPARMMRAPASRRLPWTSAASKTARQEQAQAPSGRAEGPEPRSRRCVRRYPGARPCQGRAPCRGVMARTPSAP